MAGGGLRVGLGLVVGAWALLAFGSEPRAQQSSGIDPGRDCQTLRTCNFSRTGAVRGCLSSYTCRTCKLVRQRCEIAGRTECQRFVCSWGG